MGVPVVAVYPEPIGSASIACVFQGELLTGERVAIKVKRPGIEETFAADFRALDWLTRIGAFLTLLEPAHREVVEDLRGMGVRGIYHCES